MTREEILNSPEYQAAHICFQNACSKGLELQEMAHYMFVQGIIFERTHKMPELYG